MVTTDAQVRKLMKELSEHGQIGKAAARAGMSENTARKYRDSGKLPSEEREVRGWRTRPYPFAEDWPWVGGMLEEAPELEAKALFEFLAEERHGRYQEGQLRTFQRRVREWRATEGPPKEVFFPQEHRAGEAMQTDFTWLMRLGITIGGEPYEGALCHSVLPYSNWEWGTLCQSESMLALRGGVQSAVFRLGRVPEWHQIDNSTAATHDLRTGKRDFNEKHRELMKHLGMRPRTIAVGQSEQNGDVESLNGALKRRLKQHLLLRQSCDFGSIEELEGWIQGVMERANRLRQKRLAEELEVMRPLQVARLAEHTEERVRVTSWSTVKVKRNIYSVPSQLTGERVTARVYEDRIEIYLGRSHQLTTERLTGEGGHRVDYRHIIWSLVNKPGAFARYRYRDDLFPTIESRRTWDALEKACGARKADIEYVRILHLAASTMETEVDAALSVLLSEGLVPRFDRVQELVRPVRPEVPDIPVLAVDLGAYDQLLSVQAGGAS